MLGFHFLTKNLQELKLKNACPPPPPRVHYIGRFIFKFLTSPPNRSNAYPNEFAHLNYPARVADTIQRTFPAHLRVKYPHWKGRLLLPRLDLSE